MPAPADSIPRDRLAAYIEENRIEWYASWYIGDGPDVGFRGVLPWRKRGDARRAAHRIARAEAASRIIVDRGRLARLAGGLRRRGARIVFTNGVFDLLHVGHLRLLEQARALGDALIVAINSDDSTRAIKGPGRPVIPQFARAGLLARLREVTACFVFPERDPLETLRAVRPHVLVKGSEYGRSGIVGARFVTGYGGKVARISMVKGWSTTSVVSSVRAGGSALDGRPVVG